MKLLAAFAAILAVASAYPAIASWELNELTAAIQDPATDPAQIPYLEDGLNQLMHALVAGEQQNIVTVSLPVSSSYTLEELSAAVHDPDTNPALLPYYEGALHDLMVAVINGEEDSIVLNIPAMNVNVWTLGQLDQALGNPETDPELHIYLEYALNQLMTALFGGEQITSIAVVTPPGVIADVPAPIVVNPIVPVDPIIPVDPVIVIPTPVLPDVVVDETPAENPAPVASSPLVQIIVNVNA